MHPKVILQVYYSYPQVTPLYAQLAKLAQLWLKQYDPHTKLHLHMNNFCIKLVDVVYSLVTSLSNEDRADLLTLAAFIYAERFIKVMGISQESIVNVCIASTVLAIKFWDDCVGVSNGEVADMAGMTLERMNQMEVIFLREVQYNLHISAKEMNNFCHQLVQISS